MTLAETYQDATPVMISFDKCKIHGFRFISMPRDAGEGYRGLLEKCPLKICKEGR